MSEAPRSDFSHADDDALAELLAQGLTTPRTEAQDAAGSADRTGPDSTAEDLSRDALASLLRIPGYEILRPIASGGMGRVYAAVQLSTQRTVALKVMLDGPLSSETAKRRFEREVRIAAALRHPHIAQVYESGLHAGRYWFSMELVDGQPFDTAADAAGMNCEQRLTLMATVCEAVGAAHAAGVIHRDLKPSNILVSADGQPHVLDFGLAKAGDALQSLDFTLSTPGELMGTPAYMSPEQTAREPDQVTARSDVYALGVILYRLLTGQFPYNVRGRLDEVIRQIATTEPVPPRRYNRALDGETEAILLKTLAKHPDERYESAGALAADLRRRLAGAPVAAKLASRSYRLMKRMARQRRWLLAAGCGALALLAGVWYTRVVASLRAPVNSSAREGLAALPPEDKTVNQIPTAELLPGPVTLVEKAPMPKPAQNFATAWVAGKLHVVGGGDARSGVRADHFAYDPDADAWSSAAELSSPRDSPYAFAIEGKLYVLGGSPDGYPVCLPSMEKYDPETDTWMPRAAYPTVLPRAAAVAVRGGKAYVAGGTVRTDNGRRSANNWQTYAYDPRQDAWSVVAPFPHAQVDPGTIVVYASAVYGGEIYVLADVRGPTGNSRGRLFAYDPARDIWQERYWLPLVMQPSPSGRPLAEVKGLLALMFPDDIEGGVLLFLHAPLLGSWYRLDTAGQSFGDRSRVAFAACGSGAFVLGGETGQGFSDRCQYLSFAAPLATLAERMVVKMDGDVLLEHPFGADGPLGPPWETVGGTWEVKNGELAVSEGAPQVIAYGFRPAPEWRDYVIECDYRQATAKLAVLFRVDATRKAFYALWLRHAESGDECRDTPRVGLDRCTFFSQPDRERYGFLVTSQLKGLDLDLPIAREEDHRLRIEVRGRVIRTFLDGMPLLEAEDPDPEPILQGGIGFAAETGCFRPLSATIRNLRVVQLRE
jgi:predicted Ser/Thr protein kinase